MINFRPLTKDDWLELKTAALRSWEYTYKEIFSKEFINDFIEKNYSREETEKAVDISSEGNGWSYVAEEDGRIIGFATFGKNHEEWRLFRIYLIPEYIGKGLGKQLLDLGEKFLKDKKVTEYFLYVHKDNNIAQNFYLKSGFKRCEDKDKEDELCLIKQLRRSLFG